MTQLQELKAVKSEVFAEAKEMFPFVSIDMVFSVYGKDGNKLNDGGFEELRKLTKGELDKEIEYFKAHYPDLEYIDLDFVPRGADTMEEFSDGYKEIVDGAEQSFRVFDTVVRLAYRREVC